MLRQFGILWIALAAACTSRGHAVPLRNADSYVAHTDRGEIVAGADLFDNASKCSQAFGENISRTYTPAWVVVENRSDHKFLVDRTTTFLDCDDGTTLRPVSSGVVYQEYRSDLFWPGMVGRGAQTAAAENNEAKRADWADKEWPMALLVRPKEKVGGFLYFQGSCPGKSRAIRFTAERVHSEESLPVEIVL